MVKTTSQLVVGVSAANAATADEIIDSLESLAELLKKAEVTIETLDYADPAPVSYHPGDNSQANTPNLNPPTADTPRIIRDKKGGY